MAYKSNKKISLLEFRAWLDGVEELQPKNWVPTAEQWKLIRGKINQIQLTETKVFEVKNQSNLPDIGLTPVRPGIIQTTPRSSSLTAPVNPLATFPEIPSTIPNVPFSTGSTIPPTEGGSNSGSSFA